MNKLSRELNIVYYKIRPRLLEYNRKVERGHRNDNEIFNSFEELLR